MPLGSEQSMTNFDKNVLKVHTNKGGVDFWDAFFLVYNRNSWLGTILSFTHCSRTLKGKDLQIVVSKKWNDICQIRVMAILR